MPSGEVDDVNVDVNDDVNDDVNVDVNDDGVSWSGDPPTHKPSRMLTPA